jgi:DNA-binding winged helix-turn-helix (wHTH) protein/Tol biopolymer transport system component
VPNSSPTRLQFGDVTLIPEERVLVKAGDAIALTPKAFELLVVLASNGGRLVTKEQLMQAVWPDTAVEESNLSYHVFAIRKALGDTAENGLIETVPRRGYRFTATVTTTRLEDAAPETLPRTAWRSVAWFAAGAVIAGLIALVVIEKRAEPAPGLVRAQIAPGVPLSESSSFALSPDGRQIVFAGRSPDGITRLWLRRTDEETARPLAGTETALGGLTPPMFWSPDSRTVAFDAAGELKRFDVADGSIKTICPLPNLAVGGSWNADGVIIVGGPSGGLRRCSAANASVSELTRIDSSHGETAHVFPWFLPDGRHFLYVRVARTAPEGSGVYLGSLDDPPEAVRPPRLLASGFGAAYAPAKGTTTGHVVFLRNETLFAQPFDERQLQLRGDPTLLASPVGSFLDGGFFSVSENDVIALRPPDRVFALTWFDRQGKRLGRLGETGRYTSVAIAPDDSRVAVAKETTASGVEQDIWVVDIARQATTRVTFDSVLEDVPVWSADGKRIIFTINGDTGTLFEQPIDGPTRSRMLVERDTSQHKIPSSVSPDGRFLLYTAENMDRSRGDVWVLPLAGVAKPFPLIQRDAAQDQAQLSPDGRWVAYASDESGRFEVLVRRFTDSADAHPDPQTVAVSAGGGTAPRWRRDGRELFFLAADGTVMAADLQVGASTLSVGVPRGLFRLPETHGDWDVVSDGTRFLIAEPAGADASTPFTLLWNRLGGSR